MARLRLGKDRPRRWNKRAKVDESVGYRVQDDHGDPSHWNVLLKLEILIHGDERVEPFIAHTGEQKTVLAPLPAEVSNV